MGAPTLAVLYEIYLQNLKHNQIYHILTKHNILNYFRYVDDTLLTHAETKNNTDNVLTKFSNLQKKLQFTIEKENGNNINYLDKTIHR
jgi:hypothetical protein